MRSRQVGAQLDGSRAALTELLSTRGAFFRIPGLTLLLMTSSCNLITGADQYSIGGAGGAEANANATVGANGPVTSGSNAVSNAAAQTGVAATANTAANAAQATTDTSSTDATANTGAAPATSSIDATVGATAQTSSSTGLQVACGDLVCNGGETCMTCAQDCGACQGCGDGTCNAGTEDCANCASDCGACPVCQGAGDATTALDSEELAFLNLLNQYRMQNGRGPVAACTSLNRAAQGHSEDMRDQDYFDHTSLGSNKSPWDRMCDACYEQGCGPMTSVAENIAAGNPDADATFEQWRTSPGHNTNMLGSSYTRVGLGRAVGGGTYGEYWTNVFAGADEASCN